MAPSRISIPRRSPRLRNRLLALPAELRNQIYAYALTEDKPIWLPPKDYKRPRGSKFQGPLGAGFKFPAIHRVNKQMRQETMPMFTAHNAFKVAVNWADIRPDQGDVILASLRLFTKEQIATISELTISIISWDYTRCLSMVNLAHSWSQASKMGIPKEAMHVQVRSYRRYHLSSRMLMFTEEWMESMLNMAYDAGKIESLTKVEMSIKVQEWHKTGEGHNIEQEYDFGEKQAAFYLSGPWP